MAPLPIITPILGGWDLATHADLMLQGLLFAQFTHYWTQYREYIFSDPPLGGVHLLLSALITIYVQSFFLHRLWLLSKQTYYVSCLALLFVFSVIAAIVTVWAFSTIHTDSYMGTMNNAWIAVAIQIATVVAGDVLLCGSTLYFLIMQSRDALPQTAGILHRLMRLTFQSAAPGALCASLMLICDLYYNLRGSLDAGLPLLVISSMITPKLYAISAMWTLNSRRGLRSHFATVVASTDGDLPPLQTDSETLAETVESAEHVGHGPRRRLSV
ncbi:hypothetical protein C8J57DRAFT_1516112 [Mycena rebaudengoi]|nr:hypothetical protein C8J57DRAFT_1516112 [Mycena rebaudengoi]